MANGLMWQVKQLPFGFGLQQGTDVRSRPEPFLDIASNVQFDELGGVQTRLPYAAAAGSIFGGGTIADARRIVAYNNELVLFTKDSLYSWNEQLQKWVLRDTHLAVSVDETPQFVTTGDQIDGDRAELSGTVVFAWTEGSQVYAAALDKATGSVLVTPTAVSTAIGRPKLVALATKILLFVEASTTLLTVRAIDPSSPSTGIGGAGTTVLATNYNLFYDVVRAGTQDLVVGACRRQVTTSYEVFTVTPALVVATSTKARTCDGPIAVATIANGTQTQIVRANSTNIQGDLLLTATLADVFTAQAIGTVGGTPVNQITAAFVTTTCRVFWSSLETDDALNADFATKTNTVTTANVIGAQSAFVLRVGVASRAFPHDGNIYVWLVFAEDDAAVVTGTPLGVRAALQNTYFLYRADGRIAAKAVDDIAGGYAPTTGHLPGVSSGDTANDYVWTGAARRRILLDGDHVSSAARSPREIAFAFDADRARRCVALGRTLYVTGSFIQQYDGVRLVEVGFFVEPWNIAVQDAGAGNIGAGAYSWKGSYRYVNAQDEGERSTTATGVQITMGASRFAIVSLFYLYVTNKTAVPPALEFWRTEVGPSDDSPFLLITGQNPSVTTGDNPYIPNNPTLTGATFPDNLADATLRNNEVHPENTGRLPSLAPPGAAIIKATDTRIFLGGVAGDPDRVWYSQQRNEGELASFHDILTIRVPRPGGEMTALWFQDEVLYVARETAVYAIPGAGLDNRGEGVGFGDARIVSSDVGVINDESVALTPLGTIFKSAKGWQLLTGGTSLQFIGGPVSDYDSEAVLSVTVVETQHQVRILTASRMLVWDYRASTQQAPLGQWGEWTITDGVNATMYDGNHVYAAATGMREQSTTYTSLTYGQDVETAWIKPSDQLMGATHVRKLQPLGEFRSTCLLRSRIAYNYEMDGTTPRYVDDKVFKPADLSLVAGNPLQFVHGPKRPKCQAIKMRLTAVTDSVRATLATTALSTPVATSGADWTAEWLALTAHPGELGNTLSMSLVFEDAGTAAFSIDVRDHFAWSHSLQIWEPSVGNVGVRVLCRAASTPTVAQLEAAILDGTDLLGLNSNDPTAAKTIDAVAMLNVTTTGALTGGVFGAPAGEAIKLTGLGLEFGVEPGIFRRLSAAQKL